ncbi:MAG: hypothetical protein JO236_15120, partial [Mycobacterium sp.]|uniref:hypothetical protein n=1 Tax=Mycobacterium sp. TaxID=1785 RepID=UPI001ED41DB2
MPTTTPPLDPQRTLAVVCGASEWPRLGEQFASSTAFAATAGRLCSYLVSDTGLSLADDRLLNLFDDERPPADQLELIGGFLRDQFTRMGAVDGANAAVLFTYIGHGVFALPPHREYCLLIRDTRPNLLEVTSLRVRDLQRTLRDAAGSSARLFVLDSCFAAAALEAFQGGDVEQAESAKIDQLLDEEPSTGVAMLCAASKRNPARIGSEYTVFGSALLDTLENGDPGLSGPMSLARVCELARLRVKRVENAPLPETHDPDQSGVKVSARPFFPNRASSDDPEVIATVEPQTHQDLTAAAVASRIKRELTQKDTIISAHDLITGEFSRLHQQPELNLADYNNRDPAHF